MLASCSAPSDPYDFSGTASGRFEMWTTYVSVLLAILPLLIESESNHVYEYTNGWIPVSNEVVIDQIKREGAQVPYYISAHNIQQLHTDTNKALPQNTLEVPGEIESDTKENVEKLDDACATDDINICNQAKLTDESIKESKYNFVPNDFYFPTNQNETDHDAARRSKTIADFRFNNYAQDLFLSETSSSKSKQRTYEVTEDTLELEETQTNNEGYKYELPKKKISTNGLFEILSKYKINKDDALPNYVLSRKHRVRTPLKPVPMKPQTQIFHRYNNLNHLSVDPLLAVFLSNYGFYLQSLYGVHNRHSNLYGYLASNNIHNNRPFGVYKIYSDTDSSQ